MGDHFGAEKLVQFGFLPDEVVQVIGQDIRAGMAEVTGHHAQINAVFASREQISKGQGFLLRQARHIIVNLVEPVGQVASGRRAISNGTAVTDADAKKVLSYFVPHDVNKAEYAAEQ